MLPLQRLVLIATLVVALCAPPRAMAAKAPLLLRDSEIENDIRAMASPVLRAAGLEPGNMGIYLIGDSQLNSFVAGGQAIFINTGLILRAETPNQLIGVIAHETGHITGGHVLRTKEAMRNASIESIIAMVVAAAASVVGRSGAPMLGASGVAERSFLLFSTAQEATADHAALNFLDRSCQSARGLLKFFEILQTSELLSGDRQDAWVRTHPLTQQRVQYMRDHVAQARCSNAPGFMSSAGRPLSTASANARNPGSRGGLASIAMTYSRFGHFEWIVRILPSCSSEETKIARAPESASSGAIWCAGSVG